ncbi:hypothetical protein GGD82_003404 [Roseospira marina]|nr:hypothetical protein [Roseospira marina]
MSILLRGKTYHLRRRVPCRYEPVEPRKTVWISLHTDSETVARGKADRAWAQMIEAWEARLAGDTEDAEARYAAAQDLARVRGYRYLDVGRVARLPGEDLLDRVEAVPAPSGTPDSVEASALLGTVQDPAITLSRALDLYWTLAREKTLGKSPDQLRRWRNPRIKAVNNAIAVIGDKPIEDITRDDMLDFRQWWLERIESGDVGAGSANKDLIHLGAVLKTVNSVKRLGLDLPLGELAFREGEQRTRPPFSSRWIREKLLAPGALNGLNGEARAILLGMVNTGYRPSEGAALDAGARHRRRAGGRRGRHCRHLRARRRPHAAAPARRRGHLHLPGRPGRRDGRHHPPERSGLRGPSRPARRRQTPGPARTRPALATPSRACATSVGRSATRPCTRSA